MKIREVLISFMKDQAYKPMSFKELSKIFGINKRESKDFQKILYDMEKDGLIIKNRAELYGIPERMGILKGVFQANAKGFGFVIVEVDRPDIFIPASNVNSAMNNDIVLVKILRDENRGKKCEGEIIRIVERKNKN